MSCERFIYKMSYFKTGKHLNSWKDEYYLKEEDTRFIYDDDFKDTSVIKIFVVKVCNKSPSYEMAVGNSCVKTKNSINFIIN